MLKLISLTALGLGLAACVPSQHPSYLVAAADPAVGIRPPAYSSVPRACAAMTSSSPLDWRELNRRVAPGRRSGTGRQRRCRPTGPMTHAQGHAHDD